MPHHLLDVVEPDAATSRRPSTRGSRARPRGDRRARARCRSWSAAPGLYLRALLCRASSRAPARDETLPRAARRASPSGGASGRLHRLLAPRRPAGRRADHRQRDVVRIVRALEVLRATGRPLSAHHREAAAPLEGFRVHVDRDRAAARGAARGGRAPHGRDVRARAAGRGARPAARRLRGGPAPAAARSAIARRWTSSLGRATEAEARRDIVASTMQYAKRQLTWFRHQTRRVLVRESPDGRARRRAVRTGRSRLVPPRFRRAIVVVCDGLGVGEAPDAAAFGDEGSDTLGPRAGLAPVPHPEPGARWEWAT